MVINTRSGPIVFLVADGDEQFYDDQVVTVPNGKSAKQIGTYSYESKGGERTVPIIKFESSEYFNLLIDVNLSILFCIYSFVSMKTFTFALALQLKSHNHVKERW